MVVLKLLAFAALAVLVLLAVWRLALPEFRLPPPEGPYGIGTMTYHFVDATRHEEFSPDQRVRRELIVQVWYPAMPPRAATRARYLPDADALTQAIARRMRWPWFSLARWSGIASNAVRAIPVADGAHRYPVLVFLEGLGGFRQMDTFLVDQLVSRGYVVAAIDQPLVAAVVVFPDGRRITGWSKRTMQPLIQQSLAPAANPPRLYGRVLRAGIVPYLAEDARFALERLGDLDRADPDGILTGRLDLKRAGVFGVSLGGIVASEAARIEPRFRACVVLDAPMPAQVISAGLRQPTMWITRDATTMRNEGWRESDIVQHQTTMRSAFDHQRGAGYFVRIAGMYHANFTDIPFVSPLLPALGVTGPMEASRAHAIVTAYTLAFFGRHLVGRPDALLTRPASQYPEVLFESRR